MKNRYIASFEAAQIASKEVPAFRAGDTLRLANKKNIVMVSGRYEGIDERVIEKYANEVFSIGEYILTGGELPSLVMADAISEMYKECLEMRLLWMLRVMKTIY